jgi:uncharacterized protein (TIGR03086 family)
VSVTADKYRRAVAGFSGVVAAVPADKWSAPSPCEGWTARDVVGHVIGGMQRVCGDGPEGGPAGSALGPTEDPVARYTEARAHVLAMLTETNLARIVPGPMGEMPLDQLLGMFAASDVLIHTWDLGRAAGIAVTLDGELVQETYDRLLPIDTMMRNRRVFGPKVDAPTDADLLTRLICFTGRRA